MTTPTRGLHAKLAELRSGFGRVSKTGTNKGVGQGYAFVEATEISRRFVELASALGLTMLPVGGAIGEPIKTLSEKQLVYNLSMTWRITDAASGEYIDVVSFGQGADQADKALPKAQTNAMKYAILLVLQAAGDDAEADPRTDNLERPSPAVVAERQGPPPGPSQALIRKLMATFTDKGLTTAELRHAFTSTYTGKHSSKDLTVADIEKLLVILEDYKGLVGSEANPLPVG